MFPARVQTTEVLRWLTELQTKGIAISKVIQQRSLVAKRRQGCCVCLSVWCHKASCSTSGIWRRVARLKCIRLIARSISPPSSELKGKERGRVNQTSQPWRLRSRVCRPAADVVRHVSCNGQWWAPVKESAVSTELGPAQKPVKDFPTTAHHSRPSLQYPI
jgi:hypothetical protein